MNILRACSCNRTDLTLGQFSEVLSQLPKISEKLYPEFFDIKFTSMKLTKRFIELEGKIDDESIRELGEINSRFEELDDRNKFNWFRSFPPYSFCKSKSYCKTKYS